MSTKILRNFMLPVSAMRKNPTKNRFRKYKYKRTFIFKLFKNWYDFSLHLFRLIQSMLAQPSIAILTERSKASSRYQIQFFIRLEKKQVFYKRI